MQSARLKGAISGRALTCPIRRRRFRLVLRNSAWSCTPPAFFRPLQN